MPEGAWGKAWSRVVCVCLCVHEFCYRLHECLLLERALHMLLHRLPCSCGQRYSSPTAACLAS